MYMLSLSLRGEIDVGKHTDEWTNKQKDRIYPTLNCKLYSYYIKVQWILISLKDRRS